MHLKVEVQVASACFPGRLPCSLGLGPGDSPAGACRTPSTTPPVPSSLAPVPVREAPQRVPVGPSIGLRCGERWWSLEVAKCRNPNFQTQQVATGYPKETACSTRKGGEPSRAQHRAGLCWVGCS